MRRPRYLAGEPNSKLQVFERWSHLPLCNALGGGRLPDLDLQDRPRGLDPCKALFDGQTPGRARQIIVDLFQRIPDFRRFRTELLLGSGREYQSKIQLHFLSHGRVAVDFCSFTFVRPIDSSSQAPADCIVRSPLESPFPVQRYSLLEI